LQQLEGVVPECGFENGFWCEHDWLIILSPLWVGY
jgi:hypothetical protein